MKGLARRQERILKIQWTAMKLKYIHFLYSSQRLRFRSLGIRGHFQILRIDRRIVLPLKCCEAKHYIVGNGKKI